MKICCHCKSEKRTEEFNNWKKSKDGKNPRCKVCQSSYYRELYSKSEKRKKQIRDADKKHRENLRRYVEDLKSISSCADCGNSNPIVLDFDHTKNKVHNVSDIVVKGLSFGTLKKEIKKCEIVCSNCHRIRTHNRRSGPVCIG